MSNLSWLNPTPHAIAVYASQPLSPVAPQHSLPSGRYSLLGPDFHRLNRISFAWRTHSMTSSARALPKLVGWPRRVWEPACGDGGIARPLERGGFRVVGTDLVDRGYGFGGVDFLQVASRPAD